MRPGQKLVWRAALVLYLALIYGHSMMAAAASSRESGFVLEWLQNALWGTGLDAAWITEHIVRKAAHFTEYAGLGVLLVMNLRASGLAGRARARLWLEGAFLLPFVDETIQLFSPGRSSQVTDVWLDISGVCFGTALTLIVLAVIRGAAKRRRDYEL